ncbi:methylglutaconyl-CoA hydratase AUH [Acrasis kona]|uniref:Methylglutaconyl-CoA hydratase AUH n=1 Tax=Acrasis kona TaxID=1008807 RepID=A0AAW2YKU2_9EUKA
MLRCARLSSSARLVCRGPTFQNLVQHRFISVSSSSQEELQECIFENVEEEGIVIVTLNRPRYKNALGTNLLSQLSKNLDKIRFSPQTRVCILKSSSNDIFCAGADLKERSKMTQQETAAFVHSLRKTFSDLESLPVPTIACITGSALGGGLELAMACDMRIAEDNKQTKIGLPETSLAIIPGAGGTQRLARLIGVSRAKELTFTARRIDAQTALKYGLLNECVEDGKAFERCMEVAREISKNGPVALRMAKIAIQEGMQMDRSSGMILEQQCYAQVIPTKDRLEGLKAFAEKRTPLYKGE